MKLKLIYILFVIFIGLFPLISSAQPDDPLSSAQPGDPPPPPPDPVDVPIDGGLSVLLGAGVVYGIKKVRERRKAQKEQQDNL